MNIQTKSDIDLTVQSFAYVARQLAQAQDERTPATATLHEKILGEAEKHRSALRLLQRDVFEMAEQALRMQAMTTAEFQQLRETAARMIAQAQEAITAIAGQYAPRKLAA
ncbi:hypothetical protein [Noviherbaspirillum sp.]|jgi:hypothetical protein|uniref:hypothetical protein n=1 Tax=Noviherbaspirillum sp. TaxID=1926288 RepID=UPI0025FD9581|nr:hypothetical protein [Noviherbaspirillum sp.]HJV51151.1 hypothetical protein [Noviherbaspirillum sp.]